MTSPLTILYELLLLTMALTSNTYRLGTVASLKLWRLKICIELTNARPAAHVAILPNYATRLVEFPASRIVVKSAICFCPVSIYWFTPSHFRQWLSAVPQPIATKCAQTENMCGQAVNILSIFSFRHLKIGGNNFILQNVAVNRDRVISKRLKISKKNYCQIFHLR